MYQLFAIKMKSIAIDIFAHSIISRDLEHFPLSLKIAQYNTKTDQNRNVCLCMNILHAP